MSAILTMEAPALRDEEFRVHYLADLLRRARARAPITHIAAAYQHCRTDTAGLTQEETAVLLCTTGRHYREFERGRILHPDPRFLDQVGRALAMTPAERSALTHLAARRPPAPPGPLEPDVSGLQALIDGLGEAPALVTDIAWNVLAWNRSLAENIQDPGQAPSGERNAMLWMFSPNAGDRFPGIENEYPTLVGRVRLAYLASAGRNSALQQLVDKLVAIPQAAQYWRDGVLALDPVYQPQMLVRHQTSGQVRTLCTVIPQRRLRITQFVPDPSA
jgi:transcriptional regulator with XRE-family HTH domain